MNQSRNIPRVKYRRNLATAAVFIFLLAAGIFASYSVMARWARPSGSNQISISEFESPAEDPVDDSAPAEATTGSPVYPYSVIPGGVRSAEELRRASANDPVVRGHYAGFDFDRARVITVERPQLVYVSYRIGSQIYWTVKKVPLHKGETLLTDGKKTARTRCGNQVSMLPQKLAAPHEPEPSVFDQPVGTSMRLPIPEIFRSALESNRIPPGLGPLAVPGLVSGGPLSPLPSGFLPGGSPLLPGGRTGTTASPAPGTPGSSTPTPGSGPGSGSPGSGSPGSGPGGPGTPVSAPESGTPELISAELLALLSFWAIHCLKKRRSRLHSKIEIPSLSTRT